MNKVKTSDALLMFKCVTEKAVSLGLPSDKEADLLVEIVQCFIEFVEEHKEEK